MATKMNEEQSNGLGDTVKNLIITVAPKFAEKKKNCKSCNKKRVWLNNFGAIFK
tara:strand:- start:1936 stop:2097 length:162 start_codon:yes stop_codon:yes gene_type:complete